MNGEKACGFLFPLLIATEKISEKWASCKTKIEQIPLAAKVLPSPSDRLAAGYQQHKYYFFQLLCRL